MCTINYIIESLFIETAYLNKSILFGVIYRIPNVNMCSFINVLENLINSISLTEKTCISMGDLNLHLFQTVSEATSLEVSKRPHPKFVCLYVSVSVIYLLLDHWRDLNEIFRDGRHQSLDDYCIIKHCYYSKFKVICEKPVYFLILVAHIRTYLAQKTP